MVTSETQSQIEQKDHILKLIRDVIQLEADGLATMAKSVGPMFYEAIKLLLSSQGKVVITGVGKSGLIARKIAATMSSTGTTATFLHPSDGMHGDLGVLSPGDIVIAIGKSGESEELVRLIPALKRLEVKLIAMTSRLDSILAKEAAVVLHLPVEREACPLDLAPTVSTTVALAVGDAIAVTLMRLKEFKSEDFARYHPGGKLGKRLSLKVSDLMIPKTQCAVLNENKATIEETLLALSHYGQGIVLFSQNNLLLSGILTDGDIRRLLSQQRAKIFDLNLSEVINRKPVTISPDLMAVQALKLMEERDKPLNVVPVSIAGEIHGVVRLHELLSVS